MNIVFIHHAFPGQYRYLIRHLCLMPRNRVVGVGDHDFLDARYSQPGLKVLGYKMPGKREAYEHDFLSKLEASTARGRAVARVLIKLRDQQGFRPDLICLHPDWGEGLFVREIFPDTPLLMYCEFYSRYNTADQGFDPEFPPAPETLYSSRLWHTEQILSLMTANACVSPTNWQASRFPDFVRARLKVIHEGVPTELMSPDKGDSLLLQPLDISGESRVIGADNGKTYPLPTDARPLGGPITLSRKDKLVTFATMGLEPYRGFHVFMRALPEIQRGHPDAHILVAGCDIPRYGLRLPGGRTYKEVALEGLRGSLDLSRIHFLGLIPWPALRTLYRVSSAHAYLTYPFVLSWSVLEAMSCQSLIIGSDTEPVREVIQDGNNGLLVNFFDHHALAAAISGALDRPQKYLAVREAARQTVMERYEMNLCLDRQYAFIRDVAEGKYPAPW